MKTAITPRHHVGSSKAGMSLVFVTAEERDAYEAEELTLARKHRSFIRDKYGIWAANQGKFVANPSDLNDWDNKDFLD